MTTSHTTPIAVRRIPAERQVEIPAGQRALLVREGKPERVLEPGRHPVRGWFQPQPELYLFSTAPQPLFLWITDLATADARSVNLSWQVKVKVSDVVKLWDEWLRLQEEDAISVPAEVVSAHLADPVQAELVGRFALDDLRTDREARRLVGGKLSLQIKGELDRLGLEIGEQLDFQRMRFATDADLATAQQERETVTRLVEDEKLKTITNRIENAEALRYRLREWLAEHDTDLGAETIDRMVQAILDGRSPADALAAVAPDPTPPVTQATSEPVEFRPAIEVNNTALFRRLSQFFAIGSVLAALMIAAIAVFDPAMLETTEARLRTGSVVAGVALAGLMIAWTFDQIMRWEAHKTANRLLADANLDPGEVEIGRMEIRHLLILLGGLAGLAAAAVAFWIPDLYPWFRLTYGFVGLMGAAMAIRLDWLHNIEASHHIRQSAQRRIATALLSGAQRQRRHQRFQADLAAEAGIIVKTLNEARQRVYRELNDRKLYRRIQTIEKKFEKMQPLIQTLQNAADERPAQEWEELETQMADLQEEIKRSSDLATAVHWHAGQGQVQVVADRVVELEESAQEIENLLMRWPAMMV